MLPLNLQVPTWAPIVVKSKSLLASEKPRDSLLVAPFHEECTSRLATLRPAPFFLHIFSKPFSHSRGDWWWWGRGTVSTQIYGKPQWEDKNSKSYLDQKSQMPVVSQKPLALHRRWHQGGQRGLRQAPCVLGRELSITEEMLWLWQSQATRFRVSAKRATSW